MKRLLILLAFTVSAQTRQVVITIDDLPRGGDNPSANDLAGVRAMTEKLLRPLRGTQAIGFVNPGSDTALGLGEAGLQSILKQWLDHGLDLGNHTHTHPNINQVALAEYTADILRAEPALTKARGRRPVYFRHPFLHTGQDEAARAGLADFLRSHNYQVAPVTIDNSDWMFARVYANALRKDAALAKRIQRTYVEYMETMFAFFETRGAEVTGGDFPQILLLHANQLNADTLPELLAMMRRRGYQFVSLETALRHPAYALSDGYTGPWGLSWIHRWAKAKALPTAGEPAEPKEILDLYRGRAAAPPR